MPARPDDFARIYDRFQAPIARFDCGRKCAPLNGGEPVCCSTQNAVPLVLKTEWQLLKSRTRMWHLFEPFDGPTRRMVANLHSTCTAIECKGARHCERENRALACRSFPFFPYITRERAFIGLAYYWDFEDSCWVISNLAVVDRAFVREFVAAHEVLFAADPDEYETFRNHAASMRRVFSRKNRFIPLIGRDGGFFKVLPRGGRVVPADPDDFPKHGPYRSARAYAKAVREADGRTEIEFQPDLRL
jgi:hypothetical protein